MIIRLPIDIKLLYLNIKNDNESGHTATVATSLNCIFECLCVCKSFKRKRCDDAFPFCANQLLPNLHSKKAKLAFPWGLCRRGDFGDEKQP